jgi:diguanylate cyclase (GGDEF)-like protein
MTLAPSAQRFPELFPFHLVVDHQLLIRQMGPAVSRLLGREVIGAPLADHVLWQRPLLDELSFQALEQLGSKLTVLQLQRLALQLKGQVLVDNGHAFFLGNPVVQSLEHLSGLGIRLSDIPRHDALADALVMLQTKDMTIADLVQRRTRDLEQLATRDALTGVGNRLLFNRELASELEQHQLSSQPLALLLLDVDHFKRINDSHGHLVGDACLQAVASQLQQLVSRSRDRVYRYGGEEFAVLLPGTDLAGAQQLAQRIVVGFATTPLHLQELDQQHQVTVSVGLACAQPGEATAGQSLLALADTALYQAKNSGRSCFVSVGARV